MNIVTTMFLTFPYKSEWYKNSSAAGAATIGGETLRFDFDFTNHNMEACFSRAAGKSVMDYHQAVALTTT